MIVCICRRVSDRDIARHARAGLDFDEIQIELGVAMQCGQCEGCARDVVAQCSVGCTAGPVAHISRQDSDAQENAWTSASLPLQISPA